MSVFEMIIIILVFILLLSRIKSREFKEIVISILIGFWQVFDL